MTREVREVRAGARREGYQARFFERGGKFRMDWLPEEEKPELPRHFEAVLKIIFRGRGGGAKERWLAILVTLYAEGKLRAGERLKISRGLVGKEEKMVKTAARELEELDGQLAGLYGEEKVVFGNIIEVVDEAGDEEEGFEGSERTEFDGSSPEKWFFERILVPEVEAAGGRREQIIPQLEFSSLFPEEKWGNRGDRRRADFFVTGTEGRGMVIEVDDTSHEGRTARDEARDKLVRANRFRTFRIKDAELRDVTKARRKMKKALRGFYEAGRKPAEKREVQNASGKALRLKNASERKTEGFNGKIWVGEDPENPILVEAVEFPWVILSHKNQTTGVMPEFSVDDKTEGRLGWLLKYIFGFEEFREGQLEAILRTLRGEDAIVLLPTGSGKSMIYQFLALVMPGVAVVVEPLRALMEDQVANLGERGIEVAVNLSEEINPRQKKRLYKLVEEGAFTMIYMTPERMQIEDIRALFLKMKRWGVAVSFLAIDEAHCVSEWGHDFRVPYLSLAETGRRILEWKGRRPRVLALTGTASRKVLDDMVIDIGIPETGVVRPRSFDRPEIHYRVIWVSSGEKSEKLEELIRGEIAKDFPELKPEELQGIVFCIYKTETSEFGVESVYRRFVGGYGEEKIAKYYGANEKAEMRKQMARFKGDEARLMVATKAFGMGIDKGNIRFTVHFGITNSIEAFYQEAGRAGRDGKPAMAYIVLSDDYPKRNRRLLTEAPIEQIRWELRRGGEEARDDVNRILYLHQKHYDRRMTMMVTERLLFRLGRISTEMSEERKLVARNRYEFEDFQKILYRLKILDVVEDYTIFDFANKEFSVVNKKFNAENIVLAFGEYVSRYKPGKEREEMNKIFGQKYRGQREFLMKTMEVLTRFTESVFERSRRRAILEMLELAERGACIKNLDEQDAVVRRGILKYLDSGEKR